MKTVLVATAVLLMGACTSPRASTPSEGVAAEPLITASTSAATDRPIEVAVLASAPNSLAAADRLVVTSNVELNAVLRSLDVGEPLDIDERPGTPTDGRQPLVVVATFGVGSCDGVEFAGVGQGEAPADIELDFITLLSDPGEGEECDASLRTWVYILEVSPGDAFSEATSVSATLDGDRRGVADT